MIHDFPWTDMHELNLDWFLAEFKKLVEEWNQVQGEWTSLHDYVQNYFDNLNVQTEIDNKINAMILDGTFADIVSPFVTAALPALVAGQLPDVVAAQISAVVAAQINAVVADQLPSIAASAAAAEVSDWLAAHIDPDTGYVIDDTFTVSSAASDSKAVGDEFNKITGAMTLHTSPNLLDLNAIITGKIVNTGGSEQANPDYNHTDYIPVTPGDVLYFTRLNTLTDPTSLVDMSGRFVAAFDSSKVAVSASGAQNVGNYTVPAGIAFIIVSYYYTNAKPCISVGSKPTLYEPYGTWYQSTSDFLKDSFTNKTSQTKKSKGYYIASGDLNASESLTIPVTNVKKNRVLAFSGKFTGAFTSLVLGQNMSNYDGRWFEITSTKIIIHVYLDQEYTDEVEHGLTLSDYIIVNVFNNDDDIEKGRIEIISNGNKYGYELAHLYMDTNSDYTATVGQSMTDCVFTFSVMDANKDCWIFGDSYMSLGVANRIPYYFEAHDVIDNVLINAYPGENPQNGIAAFISLLSNYGRCRYALFALGMNGGADVGAVINSQYKESVNKFLAKCLEYDITPVLCTIPTVPSRDHEARNTWIRSMGYQYVDLAAAVGAQSDGTWYAGMLSADNVHPTALGAEVLANAIMKEFPQMMIKN